MSNKPVLITGAATPLGHEVARTLLAAGREVVALINENDTESLTAVELEAQGARYAFAVGHGRAAVVGRAIGGLTELADLCGSAASGRAAAAGPAARVKLAGWRRLGAAAAGA